MSDGNKGGKKKFLALIAAVAGALFFFKKKRGHKSEPGWEEANPSSNV